MVALLKREHMKDVAAWPSVEAAVREAIPRVERYGITREDDLETFNIALEPGIPPYFARQEAFSQIFDTCLLGFE